MEKLLKKFVNFYLKITYSNTCRPLDYKRSQKEAIEYPVKIKNLYQYVQELKKGTTDFDFSELDMNFENIQDINLENLNLNIDLRKIFVPYNGMIKIGNNVVTSIFSFGSYSGDYFLKLNDTRLSGNNVTGDLTLFEDDSLCKPVYVWYSEETFDDDYKSKYPQFFISQDAPEELRQKYYNPQFVLKNIVVPTFTGTEQVHKSIECLIRQELTLDEYLKYYKFLKGKYLGNFLINKQELIQIEKIEKYGLEHRDKILELINSVINDINKSADYETFSINAADEKGVSLTLKLKFKQ